MADRPPATRHARRLLAIVSASLLAVALGLAAEVWLQAEARLAERAVRPLFQGNVFARSLAEQGLCRSLWKRAFAEYRPNARCEARVGDTVVRVEMNDQGFRSPAFQPVKPAGTLRIACIGASTTVQGTSNDRTYPALLERRLRELYPDRDIEVLNLGISATRADYWLQRRNRRKLVRFDPDVVVQLNAVNDIGQISIPRWFEGHEGRRWLYRSRLAQRLFPPDPRDFDDAFADILRSFERMAREWEGRGVPYVVASFAAPDHGTASRPSRQLLDVYMSVYLAEYPLRYYTAYAALLGRFNSQLEELVRARKIRFAPVHRAVTDPSLFTDICHMTDAGIEKMAEAFLPAVVEAVEARLAAPTGPPAR